MTKRGRREFAVPSLQFAEMSAGNLCNLRLIPLRAVGVLTQNLCNLRNLWIVLSASVFCHFPFALSLPLSTLALEPRRCPDE